MNVDYIIGQRFRRLDLIGQGNCGRVFIANDLNTESLVALKLEHASVNSLLQNEFEILSDLNRCSGIPKIFEFGHSEIYTYLAMQLLGPSLDDKFIECEKKFSCLDFTNYAKQILKLIENIHFSGVVHRDIKPRQILFGPYQDKEKIFLVDFGVSFKYQQVEYAENCGFVGTCNYCSVNTHRGVQQSRRDDLESFCYVLAYFFTGGLPWASGKSDQEVQKIKETVKGKDLYGNVKELIDIYKYVKLLQFSDEPDYEYIREQLESLESRFKRQSSLLKKYTNMPISKPKKVKKKFIFIEDTEEIVLNLDTTIVNKGPEIDRSILRKHY